MVPGPGVGQSLSQRNQPNMGGARMSREVNRRQFIAATITAGAALALTAAGQFSSRHRYGRQQRE